jgi:hypothetical protein
MAVDNRQNTLLASTVWQKLYRTFSQTDFKSYDFDTIRRTLIDYLQLNYPESFNDYIDSSEFVALIDLIAYVGQSISYRVDLNARENFIDLAERKESVLRLARLISYQPKRNIASSGFLKIESISTTEEVFDANGQNLSNTPVLWNDLANNNWQEQFATILNAAMPKEQFVGKPQASDTIGGIPTQLYRFNSTNLDTPVYQFSRNVNGVNMPFEIVPCSFLNEKFLYEEAPVPGNAFSFIFKNDSQGFGSKNTGYFVHFRQGAIGTQDFSVTNTSPNTTVTINQNNINNDDVWLFKLDQNGVIEQRWTKVPAITGNNVIYNSLENSINNQFAVVTKTNDQINLVFSDGVYGTLPQGNFRCVFRQSNNLTYQIQPSDLTNVTVEIEYVSRSGQINTLTLSASLQNVVTNASSSQSVREIKTLAPQSYYTNNRMITPEDYQITPLVENPSIAKIKSQMRTSSGISRFLDIVDPTGVYSQTDIFSDEGILYRDQTSQTFDFQFTNRDDVLQVINTTLGDVFTADSFRQFYYRNYPRQSGGTDRTWNNSTQTTNQCTGYFQSTTPLSVGTQTTSNLRYVTPNSLIKFTAPAGYHFMDNGTLMLGDANHPGSRDTIWCKVVSVEGDGSNGGLGNLGDGTGPVILNDLVPSTSILSEIIPEFVDDISSTLSTAIIDNVVAYKNFGLSYNTNTRSWFVIDEDNLNTGSFSLSNQGNTSNSQLDSSWMVRFETNGVSYTVTYRSTKFVFHSYNRNKFYFDESVKIFDPETGNTIKDKIRILKTNTGTDLVNSLQFDYDWQIYKNIVGTDGYSDTRKVQVGFFDSDDDGVVDNPDLFELIVGTSEKPGYKYVFFQSVERNGQTEQDPVLNSQFVVVPTQSSISDYSIYPNNQKFYFYSNNEFKQYSTTTGLLSDLTGYTAYRGRDNLLYQYKHGAPRTRRIDPAVTNIVDVYVITKAYDTAIRTWLRKNQSYTRPSAPTINDLENDYSNSLEKLKSVSDQIIFNPGKYKLLFGPGADASLQATFKVVKNPNTNVSDNQLKSQLIQSVNDYFSLGLWDFADTFYFTELAAYLHNQLAPDVLSVVIVPAVSASGFGSLFQIRSQDNEILISSATVDNVEVISSITAEKLKSTGNVVTSTQTTDVTATSSSTVNSTTSTTSNSSVGGYY